MTKQQAISLVMAAKIGGKYVETQPSQVLVNDSKTNSAATPRDEKQMDEFHNNQLFNFHFYAAKEKEDNLNVEKKQREIFL